MRPIRGGTLPRTGWLGSAQGNKASVVEWPGDFVSWVDRNQGLTAIFISVLALVKPWQLIGWWWDRQVAGPKIVFRRVPGESDNEIVVEAINPGSAVASDVRFVWSQRSPCVMDNVPQPAALLPGVALPLVFVIDPTDLHLHQFPGTPTPPLGLLEVWYRGKTSRRKRAGFALITPTNPTVYGIPAVTLSDLPR